MKIFKLLIQLYIYNRLEKLAKLELEWQTKMKESCKMIQTDTGLVMDDITLMEECIFQISVVKSKKEKYYKRLLKLS